MSDAKKSQIESLGTILRMTSFLKENRHKMAEEEIALYIEAIEASLEAVISLGGR